jgi:hypothetical protein
MGNKSFNVGNKEAFKVSQGMNSQKVPKLMKVMSPVNKFPKSN